MKIKNQVILSVIVVIGSFVSYTYASTPLQSFRNTVDKMPIEKRIDFYQKAISILGKVENNPAATSILQTMIEKYDKLTGENTLQQIQYIPNIDYATIRQKWIEKHNNLRSEMWLDALQNNDKLNKTAQIRANYLASNTIPTGSTHKRSSTDTYYDYDKILQWFGDQGVFFTETTSNAFSENIGYWYYRACNLSDCTTKLLSETRSTRDFFVGEAKSNGPHYRAIVQPLFTQIGIGVARNDNTKRYYLVVHYGVETID